jgi:hypothetical protein
MAALRQSIPVKHLGIHGPCHVFSLRTAPGLGEMLRRGRRYAIHAIPRFPRGQDVVSYCRLVKWAKESAGKRYGTSGPKMGNAYLKWAFSEAPGRFLWANPAGQKSLTRLEKKQSQGKALTVLAHKFARAVSYLFQRQTAFALPTFLRGERREVGEPAAYLATSGMSLRARSGMGYTLRLRTHRSLEVFRPAPWALIGRALLLHSLEGDSDND